MAIDPPAISRRIARARKAAGLNQHQLADRLGVHWRSVQNWERPDHSVPWDRLNEISGVTSASVAWLLGFEDEGSSLQSVPAETSPLRAISTEIAGVRAELLRSMDDYQRRIAEQVLRRVEQAVAIAARMSERQAKDA